MSAGASEFTGRAAPGGDNRVIVRKRLRIAFGVLLVAALALAAWFAFHSREPVYQGRRLSKWIRACGYSNYDGPETDKARTAVRQIGTNAIPFFLGELQTSEYPWEAFARQNYLSLNFVLNLPRSSDHQINALFGFEILEQDAAPAIPWLLGLCTGTNLTTAVLAFQALAAIKDEKVIPQLISWLTSADIFRRYQAAACLGGFGSRANIAVTNLIPLLQDSAPHVRYAAAKALGEIGDYPGLVVPHLTSSLADTNAFVYREAVVALGQFGQAAAVALPAIRPVSKNDDANLIGWTPVALNRLRCELTDGAVTRGSKERKAIAVAFTGHQFAEGGEVILRELEKHRAKASFFLTGDFVTNAVFATMIRRIIDDGHYYGSHSDKHLLYCSWDKAKQTLVTRGQLRTDLQSNHWKLEQFETNQYPGRYFIPPFEHYNRQIVDWAKRMNFALINYTPGTRSNADYTGEADTNFVSSQAIFDSIVQREREDPHGLNGFILLFHLGSGPARADKFHSRFGELLDTLAAKGYQFVRVDELLEPKPETDAPNQAPAP